MPAPPPPYAPGQLVLPDGTPASENVLPRLAADADFILVGERHDNPRDHLFQARLLQMLAQAGHRPSVGLEMLPYDCCEATLNAFAQGRLTLDRLPGELDWQERWGFPFALYEPVFAVIGEYGLDARGLNLPSDLRQTISRGGPEGLSSKQRQRLPKRIIPPLPEQREKLAAVFRMHEGMRQGGTGKAMAIQADTLASLERDKESDRFERFLLIQSLWDSTMAEQARLKADGRPMVILAGGGHVEYGYGIAHRLRILDPQMRLLSIMPFSGRRPEPGEADLFYYSPVEKRGRLGLVLAEQQGRLGIKAVIPQSRAAKAGLLPGDVLLRSGDRIVRGPADLHAAALAAARQDRKVQFTVLRNGEEREVEL